MSIRPVSTNGTYQPPITETPKQPINPIRQDSVSSHPDCTRPTPIQIKPRSPLAIICDFLECVRYFIASQIHKVDFFFNSCLSKIIQSPSKSTEPTSAQIPTRNPSPARTSRTSISLPDPAAGALIPAAPAPNRESLEDAAFRALPITDIDKENIRFIINTLATIIALPAAELETRGQAIRHIHPFIFWEYILSEPSLIEDIKALKSRYFGLIWGQFTEGCIGKIQAMHDQGLIASHLNAFARSIHRNPEELTNLMRRSWLDFLNNLVDSSGQRLSPSPRMINSIRPDRDSDSGATTGSSGGYSLSQGASDPSHEGLLLTLPLETRGRSTTASSPQGSATARAAPEKIVAAIPMTNDQKQKLNRLLTDISQNSPFFLGIQIASLRSDWYSLQDVHPLKLLLEVFNNPTHVAKIDLILGNNLKKGYFLNDFANTLKAAARNVELRPYFHNFAREMAITEESLERITAGSHYEWQYLIRYLFHLKRTLARATTFSS